MEYWSDGFKGKNNYSVLIGHHSITPILPGPDPPVPIQSGRAGLTYKARFLHTTPTRYCRNNGFFQPSRASRSRPGLGTGRAGHNSYRISLIDYH